MNGTISFVVGDDVMKEMNPRWNIYFDDLYQSDAYQKTEATEKKGRNDLDAGRYRVVLKPEQPRYTTR